jgi:regulation of enolase protein 1 (concanavalin A-like superfamily)
VATIMSDSIILIEEFNNAEIDKNLGWLSPPKEWKLNYKGSNLIIKTDKQTDFWQKTHYGFQADNGHFLYYEVNGDFRLTTKVKSKPENRYDQAGLMVRFSSDAWLKTSVEYIPDGNSKLGVVVTNQGYSDWSSQEFSEDQTSLFYRITRRKNNYYVDYSLEGISWSQIRMTHLVAETDNIKVGIYACSPQGEGYEAEFDFIKIENINNDTKVY